MDTGFRNGMFVLFAALAANASAATFQVGALDDAPDALPGDGICLSAPVSPNLPACTLRAAIMEANANNNSPLVDTISLASGAAYSLTRVGRDENQGFTGDLDVLAPLRIQGHGATIDAEELDRVLHVLAATTVSDLMLTGGDPGSGNGKEGGGVRLEAAALTLDHVRVQDNQSDGMHLENCVNASPIIIKSSEISGSSNYGAIALGCSMDVRSSTIYNNQFGALYVAGAGRSLTLANSTISGNADLGGSAVTANSSANVSISYSSIVDNGGVGIVNFSNGSFSVQRTIFAHNTDGNCSSNAIFKPSLTRDNVYDDLDCASGDPADHSIHNVTAFLAPLGYHGGDTPTHRPLTVSPALDRIAANFDATACDDGIATDQRDLARPVKFKASSPACDTGAVELESDVIFFDELEWF